MVLYKLVAPLSAARREHVVARYNTCPCACPISFSQATSLSKLTGCPVASARLCERVPPALVPGPPAMKQVKFCVKNGVCGRTLRARSNSADRDGLIPAATRASSDNCADRKSFGRTIQARTHGPARSFMCGLPRQCPVKLFVVLKDLRSAAGSLSLCACLCDAEESIHPARQRRRPACKTLSHHA